MDLGQRLGHMIIAGIKLAGFVQVRLNSAAELRKMRLAISPRSRSICGSTIEPKIDRLEVEGELTPVGQSDGTGNYFSQATFIGFQGEC